MKRESDSNPAFVPAPTGRRAPEQAQISISLAKDLLERIDAAARAENRNRSNFITTHIEKAVADIEEGGRDRKKKKKKG
jgi:metal-responsive CopG/Arc/MetJ family transcriptional regulator